MNDKIKELLKNAEQSDSIAKNKWRIENREQLREQRKKELKELMEKAITSLIILIGIIIICIGVVNSKVISIAVTATPVLVLAYFCIYSTILRNKKK